MGNEENVVSPEIRERIGLVNGRIEGLEKIVDILIEKLGPVLSDFDPSVSEEVPNSKTVLGKGLLEAAIAIGVVQQKLDKIIIHCEL